VSAMPPYPRRLSVYGLSLLLAGLSLSLRAEPDLSTVQTFLQQTRFHQAEQALEIAFAQEKKNELYYTIKGMVASWSRLSRDVICLTSRSCITCKESTTSLWNNISSSGMTA
jgi:hypothetical protein